MSIRLLQYDSPLTRTEAGTAKMRARSSDLTPKLRSVLFLIDGTRTFGELLERAGSLSSLLESQIRELIAMELIGIHSPDGSGPAPEDTDATTPISIAYRSQARDLPPLVAAKMQLMLRLEGTNSDEIDLLGAELLDAKTLKDLAYTAKSITNRLSMSVGLERSQQFWQDAKKILTAWRDLSAATESVEAD